MTADALAEIVNAFSFALVIAISLVVRRRHPSPYLGPWIGFHALGLSIHLVALPVFANAFQHPLMHLGLLGAVGLINQTAWLACGKGVPQTPYWLFLAGIWLLLLVAQVRGVPFEAQAVAPALLLASSLVFLGSRFLRGTSFLTFWLGGPLLLQGLLMFCYPLLAPTYDWLGNVLTAALHCISGFGMIMFALDQSEQALERQIVENHRAVAEKARLQEAQIETLQGLDRAKDEFLSVLSHELRTPLNAIMGFGSILESDEALAPSQQELINKVLKNSDRMLSLIDDLLDVARIRAGKFRVLPAPCDYALLIAETVEMVQPKAEEKAIAIETTVEAGDEFSLDAERISQVVANFLINAIKFSPSHGTIDVRAFRRGEEMVTEVSDRGIGIAAEDQTKLFMPFAQVDMSNTRAAGGTGLGLSISRAIVEAHGGRIGLESVPGKGSTFWFTLPLPDATRDRSRSRRAE